MGWAELADSKIKEPFHNDDVRYEDGNTRDIMETITYVDTLLCVHTKDFSKYLKSNNTRNTLSNVWSFVKSNIKYIPDEPLDERVKLPSMTWFDKYGDCKSMSVLIASILMDLGIEYKYRFVSFLLNPSG